MRSYGDNDLAEDTVIRRRYLVAAPDIDGAATSIDVIKITLV